MNEKTLLEAEIARLYEQMSNLSPDSDEYAKVEDNWTRLVDRMIEIEKIESTEAQNELQRKEDRRSRIVKNIIDVGAIVLPLGVTIWGAILSFTFEERGTITSNMGRKFMDKLIKK